MGRHGGRSDEITDLGYEQHVHIPDTGRQVRWWDDVKTGQATPRPSQAWWDDAPVPPPVVVASADGRTPAVTFPPGADPFSAGGVFAPTGARHGEASIVVHPAPDAAVLRPAKRRTLSPPASRSGDTTGALRLLDGETDTGSLVRPYVAVVEPTGEPDGESIVESTDEPTAEPTERVAAPAPAASPVQPLGRPARRTGGPLDLIVEPAGPSGGGERSVPWASEPGRGEAKPASLFEPRPSTGGLPAGPWAPPREQELPSRKALRAQERATRVTRTAGAPVSIAGSALAGADFAGRSTGKRLAKSGVLAVTAIGVVAASAPNAFSALGWRLPAHDVSPSARAALVDLTGSGALPAPAVALGEPVAADDLSLSASKVEGQRRLADAQAAKASAQAAAARAGVVAAGTGRTLVDVARDQVRAEAARKAAIADRVSRNVVRDPRSYARLLLAQRGWGGGQFSCLDALWNRESGWNPQAYNPSSGAYGIPQALPGSKMATIAADWRTNPATQIAWGLRYIADRYGTPCGAWAHSQATGWY